MLIQGTQPTVLSNERKRHSETVMLQATFFWNPFCGSPRKLKRPKPDVNLCLLPGLKFFSGGLLSGLVFAQWITTCTRPKPASQDQWESDRGKFINKIPWKFGPAPFTSENGVFCQLRRHQISDNFNGVKAFIYTQTWSIKSVRQRGGLFSSNSSTQDHPGQGANNVPWPKKKHFHTNLEKYSLCCQYVAVRKTLSQTKLKGKPQSKNAVDRLIKNSLAKPPQLKHVKTSLVQWNETKHLKRWNTKDCYTMVLVTIHSSSTAPAKTCPTPGQRELTKTVWLFGKTAPDETGLVCPLPLKQSILKDW